MEKKDVKVFDDMFDSLTQGRLAVALRQVRAYVGQNPYLMYDEGLDDIERDFGLMLDYMGRGIVDEHRERVYNGLLQRLGTFVGNLFLSFMVKNNSFFADLSRRSVNGSFTADRVKLMLEGFVTDMAMLSLEPEETQGEKSEKLYADHTRFMQQLFCHIIVSRRWTDAEMAFYTEELLSPLVDTADAQLIASAITIALVNIMDPCKFTTLMEVYLKSRDERIRQRAFVGWVFAFASAKTELQPVKRLVLDAVKSLDIVRDLADLQKQMMFCVNAERDNDTIRKDIMPVLMRNNNLNITRFGITEKDETEDDIFDPGATDRRMEQMEESFRKMINMQKAGSDIYFGGFSQMKRFPFFYHPANWFMPFFKQHPDISNATNKIRNSRLFDHLVQNGMFCESDKYSFAIAISSIVDKLPPAMAEMLDSKEAIGPNMDNEKHTPAYIRRLVLQDLYRFFKLFYPQTTDLINPFKGKNAIFIAEWPLRDRETGVAIPEINDTLLDIASFMLKQNNKEGMEAVLGAYDDDGNPRFWMLRGLFQLEMMQNPDLASTSFGVAKEKAPNNRRILSLLARAYFESGRYGMAAENYGELYQQDTENKAVALNYSIALAKNKQYDEAANLLYRLTFESEANMNVTRVLAWTLMGQGKLAQADKEYKKLLDSSDTETGDYLNAGYCRWFMQDLVGAVGLFRRFIDISDRLSPKNPPIDIEVEMEKDRDILKDHGVSGVDFNLMVALLNNPAQSV